MSAARHDGCVHDTVVVDRRNASTDVTVIGPADPGDDVSVLISAGGLGASLLLAPAEAVKLGLLLIEAGRDNQDILTSAVRP